MCTSIIVICTLAGILLLALLLSWSSADTIPYAVTGKIGEIEFRHYPELVLGTIEFRRYPELILATVRDPGDDSGFEHLFRYITGNNRSKKRIAMTAPVITSEKIPMTAPVLSVTGSMSFVMPQGRTESDLPAPRDPRVILVTIPPREVADLRLRGNAGPDAVKEASSLLIEAIEKAGIRTKGEIFLLRYNPPWTPGFLRRNEVAIDISR